MIDAVLTAVVILLACAVLLWFLFVIIGTAFLLGIEADLPSLTEEEAKMVIREYPGGDILLRMEALEVAGEILGDDAGIEDVYRWAEGE